MIQKLKKFHAEMIDGKIVFNDEQGFDLFCSTQINQPLIVTIERYFNKRTLPQNSYYWGVVLRMIAEYTGHFEKELDDLFCSMFIAPRIVVIGEEEYFFKRSTSDLDTVEMNMHSEHVRMFAAERIGLAIPLPEVSY